jgi:hypothetical protein
MFALVLIGENLGVALGEILAVILITFFLLFVVCSIKRLSETAKSWLKLGIWLASIICIIFQIGLLFA